MSLSSDIPGHLPPHRSRIPGLELRGAILDPGILRDTLLPSLALNSTLSLLTYGLARQRNSVQTKDFLWPTAQVLNAWYSSIGRRVIYGGLTLTQALHSLSRPEYLLLTGVTVWGGSSLYRVAARSARLGHEDGEEYIEAKKQQPEFWNEALLKIFLPEALAQTVITLPFTAPFIHQGGVFTGYHPWIQAFSIGVWGAGLAMGILADRQEAAFRDSGLGEEEVDTQGLWSVVRNPSALSDFLTHLSFPLLLYSSDMLAPIELLGPVANYFFLRYRAGADREATRYTGEKKAAWDRYRETEGVNAFWPAVKQWANPALVGCLAIGVLVAGVEQGLHQLGLE